MKKNTETQHRRHFTKNEIELMNLILNDPNPAEAIEIALKLTIQYLQKIGKLA